MRIGQHFPSSGTLRFYLKFALDRAPCPRAPPREELRILRQPTPQRTDPHQLRIVARQVSERINSAEQSIEVAGAEGLTANYAGLIPRHIIASRLVHISRRGGEGDRLDRVRLLRRYGPVAAVSVTL